MRQFGVILFCLWLALFGIANAQSDAASTDNSSDQLIDQVNELIADDPADSAQPDAHLSQSQRDQLASQTITQDQFNAMLAAWDRTARQAELMLQQSTSSNLQLQNMRKALDLNRRQGNDYIVATEPQVADLKSQYQALNPDSSATDVAEEIPAADPGGDGDATKTNEADVSATQDLQTRRKEVETKLSQLEGNVLSANQIIREANGLISQIDTRLRLNYYNDLLSRTGTPLSPSNIQLGAYMLASIAMDIVFDIRSNVSAALSNGTASQRWPTSLILLALAVFGILALKRLARRAILNTEPWKTKIERIMMPILPTLIAVVGFPLLISLGVVALNFSGIFGNGGELLLNCLRLWGYFLCGAIWLRWAMLQANPSGVASEKGFAFQIYTVALLAGADWTLAELTRIADLPAVGGTTLHFIFLLVSVYTVWGLTHRQKFVSLFGHVKVESVPRIKEAFRVAIRVGAVTALALSVVGYFAASYQLYRGTIITAFLVFAVIHANRLIQEWLTNFFHEMGWIDDEQKDNIDDKLWPILILVALWAVAIPLILLAWGVPDSMLNEIWSRMRTGFAVGDVKVSLSNVVKAIVFGYIGFFFVRIFKHILDQSILSRTNLDVGARTAIVSLSGYLAYTLIALFVMNVAGFNLSSLAFIAGALSVGIGFGLQNIVQNFISGIILLIERPIKKGDWIKVGSSEGYVDHIAVRSTQIRTFDDSTIIIPNADLITQPVENWFLNDESARVRALVQVDYKSDPEVVEKILLDTIKDSTYKRFDPDSSVVIRSFEDSGINFELRYWIRNADYITRARSETFFSVLKRFKEAGINIPFPQREIRILNDEDEDNPIAAKTDKKPTK